MSNLKFSLSKNTFPILGSLIEEIALYSIQEFLKQTSVKDFKKLKKEQLEKELLQGVKE